MTDSGDRADTVPTPASSRATVDRRHFLRLAGGAAAATGLVPALGALEPLRPLSRAGGAGLRGAAVAAQERPEAPPVPLGNGEPPAFAFHAWPGGTGALYERLWQAYGASLFERTPIPVAPWEGPAPASEEDVAFLPVHRLAALLRAGHVTPTELTRIYLERLHRYDPDLLFAVDILEGRAREEAEQAEAEIRRGEWRGPLHGIPYGLKDLFTVRGTRTTWGSEAFQDRMVDEDAEVARRLREAGAVLVAKLATGEFARGDRWYRGRTRNPWNPEQGSSGSSAGPASATAAGCVGFGIGTETQGSIVSPARRCGLSALRPTFGRVSRYGGMVLAWSMDKVGPLCRSIADCALVFDAIHGADEKDPASLTTPFRFQPELELAGLVIGYDEDAPESFVEALEGLGATVRPIEELPDGRSNALSVESAAAFDFHVAPQLEAEADDPPEDDEERERRERGRFRGGRDVTALDFVQSQRRRHLLMREMEEAMEGFDMFVSGGGEVGLTNQTGHPAAVVPYDFGGDDPQPRTTTLVGRLFTDDVVVGVAHAFQKTTEWHLRRPDLSALG